MPELLPSPLLATTAERLADHAQTSSSAATATVDMEDLRCPICFALMLAPRVLSGCGGQRSHSFCAPCITFWLQHQKDMNLAPTCPIDRRVVGKDEVVTRDPALEAAIATLLVCCPNHRLGCTARFELGDGAAHLDVCAYRTVQCPHCRKPQSAERLARHAERCFKPCVKCGINVPRTDSLHHELGLCLARAHEPWWTESQASAFTIWRDAARAQLGWLLDGVKPIFDWRLANESVRALIEEIVLPQMVETSATFEAEADGEEAEDEDEGEGEGEDEVASRPVAPTWKDAVALLERSAPLCLQLAAECRTRGWIGPWRALSLRAAELDPTSIEAKLRCGEALLRCADASAACEAFSAALVLDEDLHEAMGGQAVALDMLGRDEEAARLWSRVRRAPLHAAPPQKGPRARWHVAAARARVAAGDLSGAEDLLLAFLHHSDAIDAQIEYAAVLEVSYLAEVETTGPASAAVPQPPPSSEGRDKLASAFDAWQGVLRLSPDDSRAHVRLALVEHELAVLCSAEHEAKALLHSALGRLELALASCIDEPIVLIRTARVLLDLELLDGFPVPSPITPPRPAYMPPSDSDEDEEGEEGGEKKSSKLPERPICVLSSFLAPPTGAGSASTSPAVRFPQAPASCKSAFAAAAGLTAAGRELGERPRLQRASTLLRTALAIAPDPTTAAYLGICLAWTSGSRPHMDAQRHLQNCVEMLRQRVADHAARRRADSPDITAPAPAGPPSSQPAQAAGGASGVWAIADAAFDAASVGRRGPAGRTARSVTRESLVAALLAAGQEAESIAETFAALDATIGAPAGAPAEALVTRADWRSAVGASSMAPVAAPVSTAGAPVDAADPDPPASAMPIRRELYVEEIDTLMLYAGSTLYCQQLLLQREHDAATPVLRELINIAPSLLRATFEGWGYSRGYCLLEQLWLETFAGVISASLHARDSATCQEGVSMAAQLTSMLQGKVQCRRMRHTVAEWACELAPDAARPLLMLGEAMLDQPLSGHDESEAEEVLRRALDAHRRELGILPAVESVAGMEAEGGGGASDAAQCGIAADAQYWVVLARALEEISLGRRDPEIREILREGISWLPYEVELYLQLGTLLEKVDAAAAVELYASFPPPPAGAAPSFDHAVLANSAVRLLLEVKAFEDGSLVPHLVCIGKVLGVLNIEKFVQVLDAHNQVDVIKEVYTRIVPDFDQSAFFKQKGWMT